SGCGPGSGSGHCPCWSGRASGWPRRWQRRPGEPLALGNAGYIAFLQGRRDEARSLLVEALRRGGEALRETELKDAGIHPIPEDEEFRALLRSL
ncbi:hypothetical protein ACLESO_49010, partial [Pyxidicoccus sp. 3LG]